MNLIKIKDQIYGADVRILLNCSGKKFAAYCKQCFGISTEPKTAGYFTVFDGGETVVYLILIKEFSWKIHDYALLSHEIFHCAYRVLNDYGITLTDSSEEAFACYLQFLYAEAISGAKEKVK